MEEPANHRCDIYGHDLGSHNLNIVIPARSFGGEVMTRIGLYPSAYMGYAHQELESHFVITDVQVAFDRCSFHQVTAHIYVEAFRKFLEGFMALETSDDADTAASLIDDECLFKIDIVRHTSSGAYVCKGTIPDDQISFDESFFESQLREEYPVSIKSLFVFPIDKTGFVQAINGIRRLLEVVEKLPRPPDVIL